VRQIDGGCPSSRVRSGRVTARRQPTETPCLAMTVQQACDALSISYEMWRREVEPDVKIVRIGSRKLVPRAEVERWLERHAEPASR
jgi:excisionase family DNA binding protein